MTGWHYRHPDAAFCSHGLMHLCRAKPFGVAQDRHVKAFKLVEGFDPKRSNDIARMCNSVYFVGLKTCLNITCEMPLQAGVVGNLCKLPLSA